MAARNRKGLAETTRERIKTAHILNRFQQCFSGELELTKDQIRIGEILLRKTIPDLAVVHTTDSGEKSLEDWLSDLPQPDDTPKLQVIDGERLDDTG